MRLLDDVRLIEGEILAPPIASTFEHRQYLRVLKHKASKFMNSMILEKLKFIDHGTMIGAHHWQKSREK